MISKDICKSKIKIPLSKKKVGLCESCTSCPWCLSLPASPLPLLGVWQGLSIRCDRDAQSKAD